MNGTLRNERGFHRGVLSPPHFINPKAVCGREELLSPLAWPGW